MQYVRGKDTVGMNGDAMRTDRYLDAPVEQNYTNRGSGAGIGGRWERDWNDANRTRVSVRHNRVGFLVPNERLQEEAGQRQDRSSTETSGQISYTHLFSPHLLFDVRALGRDVTAAFWSNPLATPIAPSQRRGFREGYSSASLSAHLGAHELKAGGEALFRSIEEQFAYRIVEYRLNGIRIFDRDLPRTFQFAGRQQNREQGAYLQDRVRWRSLTLGVGVRWDHYRLIVDEQAISPRVAASWPSAEATRITLKTSTR